MKWQPQVDPASHSVVTSSGHKESCHTHRVYANLSPLLAVAGEWAYASKSSWRQCEAEESL